MGMMKNPENSGRDEDLDPAVESELMALAGQPGAGTPDPEGLFKDLCAQCDVDEKGPGGWLRARPTPLRYAIAVAAIVAASLSIWMLWLRPDSAVYPTGRMVLALGALAVVVGIGLAVALRPIHRPTLPPVLLVSVAVGMVTVMLGVYACIIPT